MEHRHAGRLRLATVVLFLAVPKTGSRRPAAFLLFGFAVGGFIPVLLWQWDLRPQAASDPRLVDRQRNFYGVVSVWEIDRDRPDVHRFRMKHGAILHGQQFVAAEKRRLPLNYYTPKAASAGRFWNSRNGATLRVGVVGLGVGTLACYARPGDHFTFYEINPVVREMAEKYFTYLGDARERGDDRPGHGRCPPDAGTARPQKFDLLALDAFSGDSVPVHLLTREAMDIYRRHVAADDVIAIHATNTYFIFSPWCGPWPKTPIRLAAGLYDRR